MSIIRAIVIIALGVGLGILSQQPALTSEIAQLAQGGSTLLIAAGLIYGAIVVLWEVSKLLLMAATGAILLAAAGALYYLFLYTPA